MSANSISENNDIPKYDAGSKGNNQNSHKETSGSSDDTYTNSNSVKSS